MMLAKVLLRYWVHPVVVLTLLWTILSIATVSVAPEYHFSSASYLAIIFFQLNALIGAIIGFLVYPPVARATKAISLAWVRPISWLSLGFGAVAVALILHSQGSALSTLLSFVTIADVSHDFSQARYEDGYQMPFLARTSQMFVFFASIVCGMQFALSRNSLKTIEFFFPLIPLIMIAVVLTTRATMIFGGLLWLGGFLSAGFLLSERPNWQPFTPKGAVISVLVISLIVTAFVWLQFMRGGITDDLSRLPEVLAHLKKWPFGSLAGFSVWYDHEVPTAPTMGFFTFTGVFDLLELRSRANGLYIDYVNLGDGEYGNIYTVFRGLIDDFTPMGAYLLMIPLGIISSLGISLGRRRHFIGLFLLAAIYPFVLFSPIVSFYSFLGHMAAIGVLFIYLILFRKRRI